MFMIESEGFKQGKLKKSGLSGAQIETHFFYL